MNTKEVFITKGPRGWSVKEIFRWEGFPENEGYRNDISLAWAVFNAADSAARHGMIITDVWFGAEKATRDQLVKLIKKVTRKSLKYAQAPAIASLGRRIV